VEYAYGYNFNDETGIFQSTPRFHSVFSLRERILLGETSKTTKDIYEILEKLALDYKGKDYHLLLNNCNHFSDNFSRILLGKGIPTYLNRISRIAHCLSCFLPANVWNLAVNENSPMNKKYENFSD
jgi:deubiquitinase DESI2